MLFRITSPEAFYNLSDKGGVRGKPSKRVLAEFLFNNNFNINLHKTRMRNITNQIKKINKVNIYKYNVTFIYTIRRGDTITKDKKEFVHFFQGAQYKLKNFLEKIDIEHDLVGKIPYIIKSKKISSTIKITKK
jgi:hypothetical protein